MPQVLTSSYSRVWFTDGGAGPSRSRSYFGNWRAGSVSWDLGDITIIREPDPSRYGQFLPVGKYRGEPGNPELPITARYTYNRSRLLKAARQDCEHTLQVHFGACQNPQDYARGWDKILVLEAASISSYGTEDLGAMSQDENTPINEDVPFTGSDLYEVVRMTFADQAAASITGAVADVYVCDQAQCGACGVASDGCQVVLAVTGAVLGSPGSPCNVVYTSNGGGTWGVVAGPAAAVTPDAIFCVGDMAVIVNGDTDAMYVTDLSDLVTGRIAWSTVTSGFLAVGSARAVYSLGASETWLVGDAGYIYFCDDPSTGVTIRSAGSVTANNLFGVHACDSLNIVAVGAANTVVASNNGGSSWSLITGPTPGVVLNSVWVRTPLEWLVGTASGRLFYTINGGATWAEKVFSGNAGTSSVTDIVFSTPSVGYLSHNLAAGGPGRVLRTIDGGFSWYVMPEGAGSIPTNTGIDALAVCADPNVLMAAGRGAASDGILLRAA